MYQSSNNRCCMDRIGRIYVVVGNKGHRLKWRMPDLGVTSSAVHKYSIEKAQWSLAFVVLRMLVGGFVCRDQSYSQCRRVIHHFPTDAVLLHPLGAHWFIFVSQFSHVASLHVAPTLTILQIRREMAAIEARSIESSREAAPELDEVGTRMSSILPSESAQTPPCQSLELSAWVKKSKKRKYAYSMSCWVLRSRSVCAM